MQSQSILNLIKISVVYKPSDAAAAMNIDIEGVTNFYANATNMYEPSGYDFDMEFNEDDLSESDLENALRTDFKQEMPDGVQKGKSGRSLMMSRKFVLF